MLEYIAFEPTPLDFLERLVREMRCDCALVVEEPYDEVFQVREVLSDETPDRRPFVYRTESIV